MRTAETILGIIRERGKQGLPLEDIYRQLYNPDLTCVPMHSCMPTMAQ